MGNTQSEENSDNSHDKDKNNNNGDEEEYEKCVMNTTEKPVLGKYMQKKL